MRGASPARKDEARLKRASSWGGAGPERELVVVLLGLRVRDAHVQDDLAVLVRVLLLGDVDPDLVVAGAGEDDVVGGRPRQGVVAVRAPDHDGARRKGRRRQCERREGREKNHLELHLRTSWSDSATASSPAGVRSRFAARKPSVKPRPSAPGRRTVNFVPRPEVVSTSTEPPMPWISSLTIERPSPVPTGRSDE